MAKVRWRRWGVRALAVLAGLLGLVVVTLLVVLHSLNEPWLKRRLLGLARSSAGVELDYRSAQIELLSGAKIEGLVVQSPAEMRAFAPELARIDRIEAQWSPKAIAMGGGPALRKVSIADVTLSIVVDEHGRTSFDALSPPGPAAPSPPPAPTTPLSQQAAKALGGALPIGALDLDHVSVAVVRTDHGAIAERIELHGLALDMKTAPAAKGTRAEASLGSPAAPLELALTRAHEGATNAARARFWLTVDATPSEAHAALDLRMIEQAFAASVSADHWLHAEANLQFDPAAGRTVVTIDHTEAGDGAVTADAAIELPDAGDPIVRRAHADVDLARLLRWVPAGLVPVHAESAHARAQIESLAVAPIPHLAEGGTAVVDVNVSKVALEMPSAPLQIGEAQLSVHAEPAAGGGIGARGSLKLAGAMLVSPSERLAVDNGGVDFDGQQAGDGVIAGRIALRFAHLEQSGGAPRLDARDGQVELRVQSLHLDPKAPLAARGDLALSIALASLDARSPDARAHIDGLALRAHTSLQGHAPYALDVEAPIARLRLMRREGELLLDTPLRIEARAHDVQPSFDDPAASSAAVHAAVALGETKASLDATKAADALDFALHASAPSLGLVHPFLPPPVAAAAPWDRMVLAVKSNGRIEHFRGAEPAISHTTEINIDRPAYGKIAARSIALHVESQGTALHHKADIDLRAPALSFDGGAASDDGITLSATVDRVSPSLAFQLATVGRASTKLTGSLSFDASRHALPFAIDGQLAGLAPLAPLAAKVRGLDQFDLSQLEIALSAHGALHGVITGVTRDGAVTLAPSPARTVAVEGAANVRVSHFHWQKGDVAILTPALAWHGDMRIDGERRLLESHVEIGTVHFDLGKNDVDLNGIHDEANATVVGSLLNPEIDLRQSLSIKAVEQDLLPEYPLGDLAFDMEAERGPEGVVHVREMRIGNGLGGTTLAMSGNLDVGEGRRTLSATSSVTQDLARLSRIPERFKARGKVSVEANVTSPDLTHLHVRAAVKGEDVTVALPRAGVEIDTANGEVPITVALKVGEHGVELQRSEKRSPYSMLRFADQHPLLTRSGFLSIAHLNTPFITIAPLVGNLEIDQNVVSLRQFEMGMRNGSVTGQCGIDWDGPRSTVELHVRASGVQSSHGEPFDGNIAVAISAADRTIEGRAEILRIGERHLLDLLDLQDPLHRDPAINRIRTALDFGYPDSLRLVFDHGFASAHLELGGLARFVSIGELRGIPMGPIVDKMLAPMLDGRDEKEMP